MIFFCPQCWKEIKGSDKICPYCSTDIPECESRNFTEKLINALRHPEQTTVQRSVYILGELHCIKAIQPLTKLFIQTDNIFIKREILIALDKMGSPEAREFINKVIKSHTGLIKKIALRLLYKR